ncbi:MAG: NADH-quinone oxidoreductase subunit N, partial [Actinomycetota bacterium]|nr:NADH-quinone oxidoreductase subunit N [Actinomycetota bacterium]
MSVQAIDWLAITPPLALALAAIAVLVVDAFVGRLGGPVVTGLSLGGVVVAGAAAVVLAGDTRSVFCLPERDGPAVCSYVVDPLTEAGWVVVLVGTAVVVLLSARGAMDPRIAVAEHHFLLLSSAAGAASLVAARDLVTLVIALEVVSLPAFALAGLRRGDGRSAEAALKFFLVSVVSTAFTLLGISFVYGATGAVHLAPIDVALSAGVQAVPVAAAGVVLTLVGLAFKVAAVPFHAWVPDVYVGSPVPVAAYLSVVSKAAGLVGLLLVLDRAFGAYAQSWQPLLAVVAALTMTVGNVLALRQQHAVRLLAWSSVGQAGFMLAPLAVLADVGDDAVLASMAYLLIYGVVNLAAFAVVAAVDRARPGGRISDYAGLARRQPWAGAGLAFALLCLAGLPPGVVGLVAKVVVFWVVVEGGLGWLAVVMAVNVAIGLAYYLRWMVVLLGPVRT